jgi:hypothetical protein
MSNTPTTNDKEVASALITFRLPYSVKEAIAIKAVAAGFIKKDGSPNISAYLVSLAK